jgi:hypothetical protein
MTGVLNSNLLEGRIPPKNAPQAAVYWKKAFVGCKVQKSPKNELNLIKNYNVVSFWDVGGPHKYIWWAACLRPLHYDII